MTRSRFSLIGSSFAALALAVVSTAPGTALADPPFQPPPGDDPVPTVFCIRITDIERVSLGVTPGDEFAVEFELLNWANKPASGFRMASSIGTTKVNGVRPTIVGAGIDADGRGGPLGGRDIDATGVGLTTGAGTFDPLAIHSGRGRGDVAGLLNDWSAVSVSATSAVYDINGGTPLDNRDLVAAAAPGGILPASLVPGLGNDGLGDSAIDGGPGTPLPLGIRNVLDGFTLTVTDWDVGEQLTLNWFLEDSLGQPIGTATQGNVFGFGSLNLARIEVDGDLPGGVFVGNSGFNNNSDTFFGNVNQVPNPAEFAAELGVGITADFLNPADNVFDAETNTQPIPGPPTFLLFSFGLLMLAGAKRMRRMVT